MYPALGTTNENSSQLEREGMRKPRAGLPCRQKRHVLEYLKTRESNPAKRGRFLNANRISLRDMKVLDPYPKCPVLWQIDCLKRRSKITEILHVADNVLLTLQNSGVCSVFLRPHQNSQYEQIGYLNHRPDEIVRSFFYNRSQQAVVIVSVYPSERKSILRCRCVMVDDIQAGRLDKASPILTQEVLVYPSWIELCEVNGRILTFTSERKIFRVWSLKDYKFLFEIPERHPEYGDLTDVKASPGCLLLVYKPKPTGLQTFRILDIRDGEELYVLNHSLTTRIELVEQFCDSILIKEVDSALVIHNIRANTEKPVKVDTSHLRLNAFTFLHTSRIFLTFQSCGKVTSFSCSGNQLQVLHEENQSIEGCNSILVSRDQKVLISVRPFSEHPDLDNESACSVHFNSCSDGELLGRLEVHVPSEEICCIGYDEDRMILFLGMRDGTVQVWS